jgi:hypothetical protein
MTRGAGRRFRCAAERPIHAPGGGVRHAIATRRHNRGAEADKTAQTSAWAEAPSKVGSSRYVKSGMFFAAHCDPHDSSPPLGLGCQSPQRWKHPTHRSKSWEELAKRRASQRRPSHQARRKSKAGREFLKSRVGPALFLPTAPRLLRRAPSLRYRSSIFRRDVPRFHRLG